AVSSSSATNRRWRSLSSGSWAKPAARQPSAGDGPEALEAAAKMTDFDVFVTDMMMPQVTGNELARRLRALRPSLEVLYLTGFSDRLFKERVTLWADEAFLGKPCSVKGLPEAVALRLFGHFEGLEDSAS